MLSSASLAASLAARLPDDLYNRETTQQIVSAARALPDNCLSQYLECRLDGSSRVDLLASFGSYRGGAERMMKFTAERRERWGSLLPFITQWATAWSKQIPIVWFEFDHVEKDSIPPVSISACLVPSYLSRRSQSEPTRDPLAADLACSIADLLLVGGIEEERRALLRKCCDELPTDGRLVHVSVMSGRRPAALKLYVQIPRQDLESYLRKIGWDEQRCLSTAKDLYDVRLIGKHAFIDLTLLKGARRPERIMGLAYAQQAVREGLDPNRHAVLVELSRAGLCTPSMNRFLRGWPSRQRHPVPGSSSVRCLSYWLDIKLVVGDLGPSAKAYLGIRPSGGVLS